jgi:hypothetical protein
MSPTAAFLHAAGQEMRSGPMTGDALARSAARLLPVDGAGITVLVDDLRLPLGASSEAVRRLEELQTAIGDSPCLWAARAEVALVVDLPDLLSRWPAYGHELLRRTGFRSAASIPLRDVGGQVFAALDLASASPSLSRRLDLHAAEKEIGTPLGALLEMCMRPVHDVEGVEVLPDWYEQAIARRQDVWVAVGMVMGHLHRPGDEALGLLRAYACRHDFDLDATAAAVVHRDLRAQDLIG